MTLFQILATLAFGLLLVLTLVSVSRGRLTARAGLAWGGLWVAALLTVLYPGITKVLADLLGINRGVDVVLYAALFAGLVGFFGIYFRFRRLERQITVLTRELALMSAERQIESRQASAETVRGEREGSQR